MKLRYVRAHRGASGFVPSPWGEGRVRDNVSDHVTRLDCRITKQPGKTKAEIRNQRRNSSSLSLRTRLVTAAVSLSPSEGVRGPSFCATTRMAAVSECALGLRISDFIRHSSFVI